MKRRGLFSSITKGIDKTIFEYEYNGEFFDSTGSVKVTIDDVDNIVSNVVPKLFTRIEECIDKKTLYVYVPKEAVIEVDRVLNGLIVLVMDERKGVRIGRVKVEINEVSEYNKEIEYHFVGNELEPVVEEVRW